MYNLLTLNLYLKYNKCLFYDNMTECVFEHEHVSHIKIIYYLIYFYSSELFAFYHMFYFNIWHLIVKTWQYFESFALFFWI